MATPAGFAALHSRPFDELNTDGNKRLTWRRNEAALSVVLLPANNESEDFPSGLVALLSFSGQAQNEHFEWLGLDAMPVPTDSIDAAALQWRCQ